MRFQVHYEDISHPTPSEADNNKKTILKNTVNLNEHIEKQSVEENDQLNTDMDSVDNVKIYAESLDSPPRTQETKMPKKSPRTEPTVKQPTQLFPYPKKSLSKEKNANVAVKPGAKTTNKENDQQKARPGYNSKNLALRVVNKEASFNSSFKEDDQVNSTNRRHISSLIT